MKCIDCIHYDLCNFVTSVDNLIIDSNDGCEWFKDKSKFVELPCKLNDVLYVIPTRENSFEHVTKMECLGFQISKPTYTADLFRVENGKSHKMYNAGFDMFGDTVFFIKEEAEARLKELECEKK